MVTWLGPVSGMQLTECPAGLSIVGIEDWSMTPQIAIEHERIRSLCERWKIAELALFGSVLTESFRPDSDVDVLVTFSAEARWSLFDLVELREDLVRVFGREVDLLTRSGVERSPNYIRRHEILSTAQVIHAA